MACRRLPSCVRTRVSCRPVGLKLWYRPPPPPRSPGSPSTPEKQLFQQAGPKEAQAGPAARRGRRPALRRGRRRAPGGRRLTLAALGPPPAASAQAQRAQGCARPSRRPLRVSATGSAAPRAPRPPARAKVPSHPPCVSLPHVSLPLRQHRTEGRSAAGRLAGGRRGAGRRPGRGRAVHLRRGPAPARAPPPAPFAQLPSPAPRPHPASDPPPLPPPRPAAPSPRRRAAGPRPGAFEVVKSLEGDEELADLTAQWSERRPLGGPPQPPLQQQLLQPQQRLGRPPGGGARPPAAAHARRRGTVLSLVVVPVSKCLLNRSLRFCVCGAGGPGFGEPDDFLGGGGMAYAPEQFWRALRIHPCACGAASRLSLVPSFRTKKS